MEQRNYKIYSNGIHEIVTADDVRFMPKTGQTIFSLEGTVLHIAPSNVMITNTTDKDAILQLHENSIYSIQLRLDKLLEYRKILNSKYGTDPLAFKSKASSDELEVLDLFNLVIKEIVDIREKLIKN